MDRIHKICSTKGKKVAHGPVRDLQGYQPLLVLMSRRRNSQNLRDRLGRGQEQEILRGESDGSSSTPHQNDSTRDDAEAKNDFWTITGEFIYGQHVEPQFKLTVRAERRTASYSDEVHRRYQNNTYITHAEVSSSFDNRTAVFYR